MAGHDACGRARGESLLPRGRLETLERPRGANRSDAHSSCVALQTRPRLKEGQRPMAGRPLEGCRRPRKLKRLQTGAREVKKAGEARAARAAGEAGEAREARGVRGVRGAKWVKGVRGVRGVRRVRGV